MDVTVNSAGKLALVASERVEVLPSPIWPSLFRPQQNTSEDRVTAQEWDSPAHINVASFNPEPEVPLLF
jgi:hypothetical protein